MGWGRLSLAEIRLAGSYRPNFHSYRITSSTPPIREFSDPLQSMPFTTKWQRNGWMEVAFDTPLKTPALSFFNRSGSLASRSLTIDIEDTAGTAYRFRHPSPDRYRTKLATFRRRALALADAVMERPGLAAEAAHFRAAAAELASATLAVLDGAELAPEALGQLRTSALNAGVTLLHAMDGASLGALIPEGAWCLEQLFARGVTSELADAEQAGAAAAYILLHGLLSAPALAPTIENPVLERYRHAFTTTQAIEDLEAVLNQRHQDVLRGMAPLSLMMRVHGISGPVLFRHAKAYMEMLREIQAALDSLGYRSCICYGTLLGAVREKDFIAHDDDIDMAVELKTADGVAEFQRVTEALNRKGVTALYDKRHFAQIPLPDDEALRIDLFPIMPKDAETVRMVMEGLALRDVPRHLVLPLGQMEFRGLTVGAPASTEGFLRERYGEDWHIPRRKLGHAMAAD
jgi:hypothetical protein